MWKALVAMNFLLLRCGCWQRPVVDRQRPDFFCLAKRNRGKKRRALQAAGPAELTARVQRSVQTAAEKNEGHPQSGGATLAREWIFVAIVCVVKYLSNQIFICSQLNLHSEIYLLKWIKSRQYFWME